MSKYIKSLSDNLKFLMGEMSVSELAEKVKIPQPTLSRYILCQRQITLDNLVALADYFNVDIDILVGRKEF